MLEAALDEQAKLYKASSGKTDNAAEFWERRYKMQHDTVHRMEDVIAALREELRELQERKSGGDEVASSGGETNV
jgi:uncharacterized protein with von Willebrand factor type A (vWA) domain